MRRLSFFCYGMGRVGRFLCSVPVILVGLAALPASAEDRPAKVTAAAQVLEGGENWRYFLFLPADYEKDDESEWPMILWLHGRSLRGNDLEQLRRYGPPSFLAKQPDFPFVVVCPQLPDGSWPAKGLNNLLEECLKTYRVDENRVVLTGDSLGAMGAWNLAGSFPGRFAGLSPITAHGPGWVAEKLIRMPIRAWHGDSDEAVPIAEHVALIKEIQNLGGDAEIEIVPGGTHGDVIGMNWRDPDWLAWIETLDRSKNE